jgi:hypothetical protein
MSTYRAVSVLAFLVLASQAAAGMSSLSGPTTLVTNPNNMRYTADAYNIDRIFYWTESTSHTLANDLVVSILPPGSFPTDSTAHSNDNSLVISSGTTIDSYYINYDPQSGSAVATFEFDYPILGLITNSRDTAANDHFMLSDFLIDPLVPGANVPVTHFDARGIEPGSGDMIRWLSPTVIEVDLNASSPGDQIRVLSMTAPEPASLVLLGLGTVTMAGSRRSRRAHCRS